MPCDTMRKPNQTLSQRVEEVKKRVTVVDKLIAARKVTVKVGPQGAITFTGIPDEDRDGMTDACIYRMLTRKGSAAARMAIQRAEAMAGRSVDRKVVAAGTHSHDGGASWHPKG
jgi:hypothetical protein